MTYSFQLHPTTKSVLLMKLFDNVINMQQLKDELFKGDLNCCIIKASLIYEPFQVVIAANKALVAEKLTTRTVYSEILFNLSTSKNITQSLQKFGIDVKAKSILVAVIIRNDDVGLANEIFERICGTEINISKLKEFRDVAAIKTAYNISDCEVKEFSLIDSIISRIAAKDFVM